MIREFIIGVENWIEDDSAILEFAKFSLVFGIILVILAGVVIWSWPYFDSKDPHYYLNTSEWHCSHSHPVTNMVIVGGKVPVATTTEICDQYTMNGRDQ